MYKQPAFMVLAVSAAACAQTQPVSRVAGVSQPVGSVKTVDMSELEDERVRCESLTRPGSRIVVAQRCRAIDEEALAEQLRQVGREQDELDRLARERERRGGL